MGITASDNQNACHSCGESGETGQSLFLGNFASLSALALLHPDPEPGSWAYITVANFPDDVAIWDVGDDGWKNIGQNNIGKVYGLSLAGDGPIVLSDVLTLLNTGSYTVEPFHSPVYFRVSRYIDGTYRTNIFNFLGGRGKWGLAGTAFSTLNTMYLSTLPTTVADIPEEDIIALGAVADEAGFLAAANAEERDFTDSSQSYYFSYTIGATLYIALFTSTDYQVYGGESFYQFVSGDFAIVTNSTVLPELGINDIIGLQAALDSLAPADATTTEKGIVQLAGDLSGTSSAPVLVKITQAEIPGQTSIVTVLETGQVAGMLSKSYAVWTQNIGNSISVSGNTDQTIVNPSTGLALLQQADMGISCSYHIKAQLKLAFDATGDMYLRLHLGGLSTSINLNDSLSGESQDLFLDARLDFYTGDDDARGFYFSGKVDRVGSSALMIDYSTFFVDAESPQDFDITFQGYDNDSSMSIVSAQMTRIDGSY